jgi:hypothetical protein
VPGRLPAAAGLLFGQVDQQVRLMVLKPLPLLK